MRRGRPLSPWPRAARRGRCGRRCSARADERPDWAAARDLLAGAVDAARRAPPFDFFAGLLSRAGRRRAARCARALLTRLGAEAEDALDEFLAQALAAEARGAHDLESLRRRLRRPRHRGEARAWRAARGEVRVMTAHGAKGLEAPIVFLPETTARAEARRARPCCATEDGGFLGAPAPDGRLRRPRPRRATLRKAREDEETLRLLYVALTRARDRLVVCGRAARRPQGGHRDRQLVGRARPRPSTAGRRGRASVGAIGDVRVALRRRSRARSAPRATAGRRGRRPARLGRARAPPPSRRRPLRLALAAWASDARGPAPSPLARAPAGWAGSGAAT